MNAFLQIGLGLVPGAVITILMLCKRRVFQFKGLFFALILTAASVGMIITGAVTKEPAGKRAEETLDSEKMISLANALVLSGATREAMEIVDQYGEEYGYDEECRLLTARIAFMEGEYEKASALYSYLCKNTELIRESSQEVAYALQESVDNSAELSLIEYLKDCGQAIEDYGFTEADYENMKKPGELLFEDAFNKLKSAVKDRYELDDEINACAKAVKAISDGFSGDPEESRGFFKKQKNALEEVAETNPVYLDVACVNKAWLKAAVQGGDFSAIAQHLSAKSSYHELMIAAELYMSKLVKKSSFSETFQAMDRDEAAVIRQRLNDILEKNSNDLNSAQRKALKNRIDAFANQFKEPVLGKIKTLLLQRAETVAGTDETKVYLEIAKIENVFGDEVAMDSYLSKAIYGSQDNTDSAYVANMAKIIGVLTKNDSDSRENIKNVTDYFNEVLDHGLTVNVEKIVSPQHQERTPEEQQENQGGSRTQQSVPDLSQDSEQDFPQSDEDEGRESSSEEKKTNDPADFAQQATDFVSRTKSAITIGKIDATGFETVRAMVQVDGRYANNADELKNVLRVRDCGIEIKDFELKKVEYQASKVILLCDVSGSMEDSIGDLRNAVITFIQDKDEKENLSVITFSSGIDSIADFGTSQEDLIKFAQRMNAWGGTDMYNSVITCLNRLQDESGTNNVLILMTDGQDNYPKTPQQIRDNLGKLATENNVIVYTMGLGAAVDTNYLQTIADSGNGSFIFISGSASLSGFYDMLHAQLNCQYELTYKAEDTMSLAGRVLELEITDENVKDEKAYSLPGAEEVVDAEVQSLVVCGATDIAGMYPRSVAKQLSPVAIRLKGQNFDKSDSVSVTLKGVIDYELSVEYEDEENYKLILPPTVAIGTYDVEIVIAGKKKVITEGFTVYAPGGKQVTVYGPYRFTSLEKEEVGENGLRLKGDVIMNGWLHFEGSLYLEGDLENDSYIKVSEESGSYVDFDKYTATGLGKVFADNGKIMPIPALYDFKLYNELNPSSDYDDYRVDNIKTGALKVFQVISFDSPSLQLRPDNIRITYRTGMMDLPFQDKLLNLLGEDEMFKFNFEGSALVTNKNIGVILDTEFELPGEDGKPAKLITIPASFKGGMKAKINTIKGEYEIGAKIGFDILTFDSSLMADVTWKGNLKPNTIEIGLDSEIPVKLPTGFPIEINKIHIKGEGLDQKLANATFTGIIGISSFQVKSYAPALEKFVGDVSLLTIPEASLSIRPDPFMIQTEAEIQLFGEITINKTKVSVGTFDYTNPLLKMNGEEVKGIAASVKQGIMWNLFNDRVQIDFSGTTKVDAHSRFVGLGFEGLMQYNIEWWLLDLGDRKDGDFALGLYTTRSGDQELVFIYYLNDGRHVKKGCYFIDKNGSASHRKEL